MICWVNVRAKARSYLSTCWSKESWKKQAMVLTEAGFLVLAIDFRGYGQSRGPGQSDPLSAPLYYDPLAAVRYLRRSGAKEVSVVGASLDGWAAADASTMSQPGEIDRPVFLGSSPTGYAEKLKGRSLFIVARDDTSGDKPRLRNRRSWSLSMGPPMRNIFSKRTRESK
jgi:pimeloyl-ACP methyl ester carboxylesterase